MIEQVPRWRRVADEQMFTISEPYVADATCRMQVLRSDAGDVLLVATQLPNEAPSIANSAETFITEAWQRLVPDLPGPPPMLLNHLPDEHDESAPGEVTGLLAIPRVDATHPRGYRCEFEGMNSQQRAAAHEHALPGRGEHYVAPPPRDPESRDWWLDMPVTSLPPTHPFRASCMRIDPAGRSRAARARRRLLEFLHVRKQPAIRVDASCCWYHRVDWRPAVEAARTALARQQERGHENPREAARAARGELHGMGLAADVLEAAASLLAFPIALRGVPGGLRWVNGQHRSQAMTDQGLDVALVQRIVPYDTSEEPPADRYQLPQFDGDCAADPFVR